MPGYPRFFEDDEYSFVQGIRNGDLDFLRAFLDQHPEMLDVVLKWDADGRKRGGYALNCAACWNKPEIIEFLVDKKKANVNRQEGVQGLWTPLHHAQDSKAYAAAAMLLSLGADSSLKGGSGDTVAFCQSEAVQDLFDPSHKEKIRAGKIAGAWKLNAPKEVEHGYELPDRGYRLTDVFNFERRSFTSIVENSGGTGLSHVIRFFDEMPNAEILYQALEKLKELGGDAGESAIHCSPMRGKNYLPK